MRDIMKKNIKALLIFSMLLAVAACGNKDKSEPDVSGTTPQPTMETEQDVGCVALPATKTEIPSDADAEISIDASNLPIWLSPEYKNTNTEAGGEANALYNTLTGFLSGKSTQFVQSLNE